MADRAKTFVSACPVASTATSTSNESPASSFGPLKAIDRIITGESYLSANGAAFPQYLRLDFGSAKTFDSVMIWNAYNGANRCIQDVDVEYSTDDSSWSQAGSFTDIFTPAGSLDLSVVKTFTAQTARYWRLKQNSNYGGAYVGTAEVLFWNSADIGARLDNDGSFVATAYGFGSASQANMSNRQWNDGSQWNYNASLTAGSLSTWDWDFGSAQYIGGFDFIANVANYVPSPIHVFTSTDGSTWTWRETATSPSATGTLNSVAFSRIYSTRYLKLVAVHRNGGALAYSEWVIHATATPAAPPDPTSVSAAASATDSTSIHVRWSEATPADDNATADVVFDVTRQKDGGGFSSIATGVVPTFYVDTGLAAGAYDYKVQARNLYHAKTSTAVQTSSSVTVPAGVLAVVTTSLDDAQLTKAYNAEVDSCGGTSPYTYAVTAGALPAGLSLSSAGVISGTPTAIETASFTVTVTDAVSATDAQALSIVVNSGGGTGTAAGSYAKAGSQLVA